MLAFETFFGRDAGPDLGPDLRPDLGPDLGPDLRPDLRPDLVEEAEEIMAKFIGPKARLQVACRVPDALDPPIPPNRNGCSLQGCDSRAPALRPRAAGEPLVA